MFNALFQNLTRYMVIYFLLKSCQKIEEVTFIFQVN